MEKVFVILTFIPWFLYFYSQTKNNLKIIKNKDTENLIKNNLFDFFPINNIILYLILIYFSLYYKDATNIFVVRIMLFSAINLYLFFNIISKKDYVLLFEDSRERIPLKYVLIALIPIIIYIFIKHQMFTYYIMIAFNIFNYFIIKVLGLPKDEKQL